MMLFLLTLLHAESTTPAPSDPAAAPITVVESQGVAPSGITEVTFLSGNRRTVTVFQEREGELEPLGLAPLKLELAPGSHDLWVGGPGDLTEFDIWGTQGGGKRSFSFRLPPRTPAWLERGWWVGLGGAMVLVLPAVALSGADPRLRPLAIALPLLSVGMGGVLWGLSRAEVQVRELPVLP